MNEIREIGIEKEVFLLDSHGKIMEPKLYGFPRDEFEFLVELRSLPSDRLYPVLTTLHQEELQYRLRANKFGMNIIDTPTRRVYTDWIQSHWVKYNLSRFEDCDYTHNVYATPDEKRESHHLGVLDDVNDHNYKILTAGIHVHFSSRDSKTGKVIQLPIEKIVKKMDNHFKSIITSECRNLGEWEPKTHGFEYRSLPCNADTLEVLKKSFEIIRSV